MADLLAAVDVEDIDLAQLGAGRFARGVDERAGFDVLRNDEREILPDRRIGDHVLVGDRLTRLREQRLEVELERAPLAGEDAGIELAEDTGRGSRRLSGMQELVLRPLESRLGLERLVEGLDDAFRTREAAFRDGRDVQPLVRKLAIREVDAGDLEERDSVGSGVHIAPRRLDEARQQRRAERGQLDGDRLGQLPRRLVVGDQRGRVRLRETKPDERLLDPAAQPLLARQ